MNQQIPFLRFAANTDILPNSHFTKAYDCRFLYLLEGSGELCTREETFSLGVDSLVYYPSGISYLPRSTSDKRMRFVTVNFDFDQENAEKTAVLPPVREEDFLKTEEMPSYKNADPMFSRPFLIESSGFLRADMLRLCSAAARQTEEARALANSILSVIILEILEKRNDPLGKSNLIRSVAELVNKSYNENITIASIADRLGYHPYYLGREFKQGTGESLHRYIIKIRLKKSEDLLAHTKLSVAEIRHLLFRKR